MVGNFSTKHPHRPLTTFKVSPDAACRLGLTVRLCGSGRPRCSAGTGSPIYRPRWRRRSSAFASRRSEEHTSELQSLMRISYAVFCLKKKKQIHEHETRTYI